jgi:hypothetical protein
MTITFDYETSDEKPILEKLLKKSNDNMIPLGQRIIDSYTGFHLSFPTGRAQMRERFRKTYERIIRENSLEKEEINFWNKAGLNNAALIYQSII